MRSQLEGYIPDELFVSERFQDVADRIENLLPDLVCGTQMERHSSRKLDVPCMVISSPTHIENHLLGYYPMLGFGGADTIADRVYTTTKLGLEKHLIDLFGDAGLDYEEEGKEPSATTNGHEPPAVQQPVAEPGQRTDGVSVAPSVAAPSEKQRFWRGVLRPITQIVQVALPDDAPTAVAPSPAPVPHQQPATNGGALVWSPDGEAMLKKIPAFVRGKVRKNTEKYAQEKGYTTITADVLREAKESLGG